MKNKLVTGLIVTFSLFGLAQEAYSQTQKQINKFLNKGEWGKEINHKFFTYSVTPLQVDSNHYYNYKPEDAMTVKIQKPLNNTYFSAIKDSTQLLYTGLRNLKKNINGKIEKITFEATYKGNHDPITLEQISKISYNAEGLISIISTEETCSQTNNKRNIENTLIIIDNKYIARFETVKENGIMTSKAHYDVNKYLKEVFNNK